MDLITSRTKCVWRIKRFTAVSFILWCLCYLKYCNGFNLDTKYPLIYSSSNPQSTFGYSVGLLKTASNGILLVGAPTDNSLYDNTLQPGAIHECRITTTSCSELNLQLKKDNIIRGLRYYEELRDNGWLGVSIDVAPDDSQFVACGHLWKDRQYEMKDLLYMANGICYMVPADLNMNRTRRLLPFVEKQKQVIQTKYNYALGLAGLSAHYSRDRKTLLFGAPGAFSFMGTVAALVNYTGILNSPYSIDYRVFIPNQERTEDSYFGFAIASGKFFNDNRIYYVSGAPREGSNGKVFVYSLPENYLGEVVIKLSIEGRQMGEYFGASLCAADFNADGYDDLIVGAPIYASNVDEGRVYVFLSDGVNLGSKPYYLDGSQAFEGRFGTTVTAVGDLNLDGYNDLAVGAPFEGNGAVYIFHGSLSGLRKTFAQKITASAVNFRLKGFGLSISKGKDVDNNFYPDLAIGAPSSAQAVVLRSKPVVRISGTIAFSLSHINTDVKNCSLVNGELATCFQATICSIYAGKYAPDILGVQTVVNIDKQLNRVEIENNGDLVSNFNFSSQFTSSRSNCRSLMIFVKSDVQEFLKPVIMTVSYSIVPFEREKSEFCPTCPALDTELSSDISKSLTFYTGCGDDDKCISDLELEASIVSYKQGDVLVLGTDEAVQLSLRVSNKLEPAFQTVLRLSLPPDVDFGRLPSQCSALSSSNASCHIGNPLLSKNSVSLDIILDLKRLTSTENLTFGLSVTTGSDEFLSTLHDNTKILVLPVKSVTGVSLSGWAFNEEQYVFNRSNASFVPMTHMYQMSKIEPSPIETLSIEMKFPISTPDRKSFVQHLSVEVTHNSKPVQRNLCVASVETPSSPIALLNHESTEYGKAAVMDCESMSCHVVRCTLGPFVKRDTLTVNISAVVDLPTILQKITNEEKLVIVRSFGSVQLEDRFSNSTVRTIFVPRDLVPQSAGIPWWIYLVAILGGILLLALLTFALYKIPWLFAAIVEFKDFSLVNI
ncbi:hypothetical protein CHUAL_004603 [Chamberlinius hualienensis]